jgi:site-specific recombinase XerD
MKPIEVRKRSAAASHALHRSLSVDEWPHADRHAWLEACRPSCRLKPGGRASYLAEVSRKDVARRYGAFLGFLQRTGKLNLEVGPASQVIAANVEVYIAELQQRVRTATVWNCIYKLRRAAQLLNPRANYGWLLETERDLALMIEPRSKFDRLVLAHHLVKAGLTLVTEAQAFADSNHARAKGIRNGLMIVMLALCAPRIKNFASLEIGRTFKHVNGSWWIVLPKSETKTKCPEERRIPQRFSDMIALYLNEARPVLMKSGKSTNALWISSRTGLQFTTKNLGTLISKITLQTVGVDVSPHLFRTSAATTAAIYGADTPHLASGVLGHKDPRVTEKHYILATSIQAAEVYGKMIRQIRAADS